MDDMVNSHVDDHSLGLNLASQMSLMSVPAFTTLGALKSLHEAWHEPVCWNGYLPTYALAKRIVVGAGNGAVIGAGLSATGSVIIAVEGLLESLKSPPI